MSLDFETWAQIVGFLVAFGVMYIAFLSDTL